ncbi:hypothetical protein RJ55_04259 [Drechmeria coniospora]|nr:hypothetical protein RJ55_04259 [Drechmeria coniospora]
MDFIVSGCNPIGNSAKCSSDIKLLRPIFYTAMKGVQPERASSWTDDTIKNFFIMNAALYERYMSEAEAQGTVLAGMLEGSAGIKFISAPWDWQFVGKMQKMEKIEDSKMAYNLEDASFYLQKWLEMKNMVSINYAGVKGLFKSWGRKEPVNLIELCKEVNVKSGANLIELSESIDGTESRDKEPASNVAKPGAALDAPRFAFYGDFVLPAVAKQQGGFVPSADSLLKNGAAAQSELEMAAKLPLNTPSFFLPTSQDFGTAAKRAAHEASKHTPGHYGVVYVVHATPNMVDVAKSVGHGKAVTPRQEFVVAGGIKWSQVLGWAQVPHDYAPPASLAVNGKAGLRDHFEKAFREGTPLFQKNEDYDKQFDAYTANTEAQPKLSNSGQHLQQLEEFMQVNGLAVGWSGKFPLIPTAEGDPISGKESVKNAIPAPNEESWLKQTWGFIERHKIAIALLPAVAAANLIPGLGEVADATEVAALSVDAVDAGGLLVEGVSAASEGDVVSPKVSTKFKVPNAP